MKPLRVPPAWQQWYNDLQAQEQRALKMLAVFLGAVVLWTGVWVPVVEMRDRYEAAYISLRRDVRWMRAQPVAEPGAATRAAVAETGSMLSTVTASAQALHIGISHAEPGESNTVHVTLEKVAFSRLVMWLEALGHDYSMHVSQITLEKQSEPGLVNATLVVAQ